MFAESVMAALRLVQKNLSILTILELTSYLYPTSTTLKPNSVFDIIIIGGGTAGSALATRLALEEKYKILLIEAGNDPPYETKFPALVTYHPRSHVDWNITIDKKYHNECHENNTLGIVQGKMLGGTGELQYMLYSRGHPSNYDEWARITKNSAWQWKNVLPEFRKVEAMNNTGVTDPKQQLYGYNGHIGITRDNYPDTNEYLKAFKEAGKEIITNIDGSKAGYGRALVTVNNRERQGVAKYLGLVNKSKYLTVAKATLAVRVIFKRKKAVGVEVITDDNKKIVVKAQREVIVSAGAIKSPQILLLSGIGPKWHLRRMRVNVVKDLPVGKNLGDHPAAILVHKTNKPAESFNKRNDPRDYPAGVFVGYGKLPEKCPPKEVARPDYEAMGFIMKNKTFLVQFCASSWNIKTEICDRIYTETENNEVLATLLNGLSRKSRGEVSLRSKDPKDDPRITLNHLRNDDLDNLVEYVMDYLKVEKTEAFRELEAVRIDPVASKCKKEKKDSKGYWKCHIKCMSLTLGHYTGTCAMGSVVDGQLKVYGVKNLRVVDASVIPEPIGGNTYIPVLMIAEKAAEMIIEEHKGN